MNQELRQLRDVAAWKKRSEAKTGELDLDALCSLTDHLAAALKADAAHLAKVLPESALLEFERALIAVEAELLWADPPLPIRTPQTYTIPHAPATLVYRAYDPKGRLLYVGVTGELCLRMSQHRALSPWWGRCHRIDWVEHPTRAEALAEEAELIVALRPPFNTQGKPT